MAETPDFESIARRILTVCNVREEPPVPGIVEQLRAVWNARGAADIAKLEAELSSQMGVTASGPYVKNLDRALRSLDR